MLLSLRRIYILPTRYGLGFAFTLLVMLVGSLRYNNSMGFVLTFLLASMAVVSILYTYRNLAGLRLEADKVEGVFAGEASLFWLWFDNHGQLARHALWLRRNPKDPQNLPFKPVCADISPNQRSRVAIEIPTQRRGKIQLGRLILETEFPLGLFWAWTYIDSEAVGLVYPHPQGQQPLPRGKAQQSDGQGIKHSGQGDDFIGYRAYMLGDSPRHVDWKAVARGQAWLVKQFGGEGSARLWLTWDDVSAYRNTEAALSQLCRWVLQADSQDLFYGLRLPGVELSPARGATHRQQCLEALALFE